MHFFFGGACLAFFDFAFFALRAMIDLLTFLSRLFARQHVMTAAAFARPFYVAILILRESFARLRTPAIAAGIGPPYAQSRSSTVCAIGMAVAGASCVMQPILPVAITSAPVRSMFATFRSRRAAAISGC